MNPILVRELSPGARDAAVADAGAQRERVAGRRGGASREQAGGSPGWRPAHRRQLDALDRGVEVARQQLELAQSSEPITGVGDELDSQVLITHDGTVVASDADPSPDPRYSWMSSPDRSVAMGLTSTELSTCATDGDPGGVPLPAGEYSVYVSYAEAGRARRGGPLVPDPARHAPGTDRLPRGLPRRRRPPRRWPAAVGQPDGAGRAATGGASRSPSTGTTPPRRPSGCSATTGRPTRRWRPRPASPSPWRGGRSASQRRRRTTESRPSSTRSSRDLIPQPIGATARSSQRATARAVADELR